MHEHPISSAVVGRRRLFCTLVLGAAISLLAGACGSGQPPAGSGPTTAKATALPSASQGAVSPTTTQPKTGTWQLLPPAPVSTWPVFAVSVWTGSEMLVHGAVIAPGPKFRGVTFAYRPATSTWAKLAPGPAPMTAESTDIAVWTGSEMLVLGLTSAAYNPATNSWRPIARDPYPEEGAVVGWTGRQVIIWGGVCCAGASRRGVGYTPATDTWQKLPDAPLQQRRNAMGAWTGTELVVAGGSVFEPGGTERTLRDAAAYNPATRSWRKLPPMPMPGFVSPAVWDGTEVLFLGIRRAQASTPSAGGVAYNPATNHWRLMPPMEFSRSGFAAVWTGAQVLVWGGMTGPFAAPVVPPHGVAYNPATDRWSALPQAPLRGREDPTTVWTGNAMIVWGGQIQGAQQTTPFTDGAAYTPGTP